MDDNKIIFYVILIVIYIISRAFKKGKAPTKPASQSGQERKPAQKPISFEELLKEFTGESTSGTDVDERREATVEEKTPYEYETDYQSDEEAAEIYNRSINEAKDLKTIDELVQSEDDRHTGLFTHLRGYSEEDTSDEGTNEYLEALKDVDGARKAIVLSEILKRKY